MLTTELHNYFIASTGISIDSRTTKNGEIFFALRGENFDGNEFAEKAIGAGASYAIIDDFSYMVDERYIFVDDVLDCLQRLAFYHRAQFDIPVIALTGSNGKTTTKELLKAVLSTKYKTLATEGNLNNHIGVPLTLLKINKETEMAIIEMGANHLEEISLLCEIACPDFGFVTNIGKAHVGEFGSFENVIKAKSEMYQYLIKRSGSIWVDSNNEILKKCTEGIDDLLYYPKKGDYYHCEFVEADPWLIVKTESGDIIKTNLTGKYNFENVAVALAVGKYFGTDPEKAAKAVEEYRPNNNRSQLIEKGANTIISDAYNANPDSMLAALGSLNDINSNKPKLAILGDMLELGASEQEEHERIGSFTMEHNISAIFCGELMEGAHKKDPNSKHFATTEKAVGYLKENKPDGSLILVKGSRGMKMETLLDCL